MHHQIRLASGGQQGQTASVGFSIAQIKLSPFWMSHRNFSPLLSLQNSENSLPPIRGLITVSYDRRFLKYLSFDNKFGSC